MPAKIPPKLPIECPEGGTHRWVCQCEKCQMRIWFNLDLPDIKTADTEMRTKNFKLRKSRKAYDCLSLKGDFVGQFLEMGGRWFYHDNANWGDCDADDARQKALFWQEVADFLEQLNAGGKPK